MGGDYVPINSHPTWVDATGDGVPVLLLHGGFTTSLVLIGANYHHAGVIPGTFDDVGPGSEFFEFLLPGYVERSPDGAEHFPVVVAKGMTMIAEEPTMTTADLAQIPAPVLVVVGDDDVIEPTHTLSLYESIPESQLAIVPGASHLVPYEKPELVALLVTDFLSSDGTATTMMPIRRAETA